MLTWDSLQLSRVPRIAAELVASNELQPAPEWFMPSCGAVISPPEHRVEPVAGRLHEAKRPSICARPSIFNP